MYDHAFTNALARWLFGIGLVCACLWYLILAAMAQQPAPSAPAAASAATTCPTPEPCRVVIVTDQMAASLTGPNMVFDQAEWAARSSLSAVVAAWRNVLANAPRGEPPKPDPAK